MAHSPACSSNLACRTRLDLGRGATQSTTSIQNALCFLMGKLRDFFQYRNVSHTLKSHWVEGRGFKHMLFRANELSEGGTTPKICCSAVEVGPASGTSVLHLSGNTTQQQPFIYWWHKGRYLISTIILAHRQKQFTFPYLSVQILLPTTCSLETEQLPNDFLLIYPAEVTRATLVFQNGCLFVTQTHFSANYRLTVPF